jgi:hypothetical protein
MEWIDAEEEERGGISDGAGDAATCLPWFVLSRVPFPGWEWLKFGWVLFKLGEERWWDWMAFGDAAAVAGVRARARALGRVRGETGEKDLFASEVAVAGLNKVRVEEAGGRGGHGAEEMRWILAMGGGGDGVG